MKSFFRKLGYSVLAVLGLLFVTGLVGASHPGIGGLVFLVGVPVAIYLIFRPSSKRLDKQKPSMEVTVEISEPRHNSRARTVDVGASTYGIPKRGRQKCRFLSQEENYDVHGYAIGGLVFIGTTSDQVFDEEPAIIDPKLPVKKVSLTDPLGYWPNYANLDGAQRNRYLTWLSGGRGDTDELGYVFLYLYGFERYVLRDAGHDTETLRNKNLTDIVSELQRLRKLFGDNRSFSSYSAQLLDVIYILYWPDRIDERKSSFPSNSPIAAQFAIARMANLKPIEPLDFDWALHWLLGFGPVSRTKTVREQYPILRSLFKAVYETATDGGMKVPTCKTKLQIIINPASRGLSDQCRLDVPSTWCDPTGLKRPMTTLMAINDEVMPALRALAKSVAKKDIAGILSAWPSGVPTDSVPKLKQIVERASAHLEKNNCCDLKTLGKLVGITFDDKATKAQLKQLAAALESCGYGMAPDPLLTPSTLKAADMIVTYPGSRLKELSPEGMWVALSVQLGSLLAMADGDVHEHERIALNKVINAHPNSAERAYLECYLNWRLGHPPSTAGLKQQIALLSDNQKHELARMLINLALADGELPTAEIKQLEKLFAQLGFTANLVSELLHSSSSPTSISTPVATTTIDGSSELVEEVFQLDESALRAHAESTKEIQGVLHRIFQEEPEGAIESVTPEPEYNNAAWHNGQLDDSHDELANWLLTKDEWSMGEVTSKCQSLGLLADGALEAINNAAFDTLGDGLLELGDPVEVYRDVLPA